MKKNMRDMLKSDDNIGGESSDDDEGNVPIERFNGKNADEGQRTSMPCCSFD